MRLSANAKQIIADINKDDTKMGDIKRLANEIKKDQALALELWSTEKYIPRLLSVLVLDKMQLTEERIHQLATDIQQHERHQADQLADWLLANQLMKSKKTINQILTWKTSELPILQRLFWYYQARLRWVGQKPPENTAELMISLEKNMAKAEPEVQWAMNYCAGQIGIHQVEYRKRCIQLGESIGLYKDEKVSKNCTPAYLPEFIRIEVAKRE